MTMTVNKEQILLNWAKGNPFLTDRLLFDFLGGNDGNCSVIPMFAGKAVKTYINGAAIREYMFAFQVVFTVSDAADTRNTENMFTLRKWQDWIDEQEREKNYPDFGEKCSGYRLENLNNMPAMALRYENGTAKYQFFAKLTYKEDK